MALNKKITQVTFEAQDSSWTHDIRITDMRITPEIEFWADTPFDKSLSGALRQNVRGERVRITLSFEASMQRSHMRSLKNNILTSLSGDDDYIFFYPDQSKADKLKVIVPRFDYSSVYNKTLGRFVPGIELISYEILSSVPPYLEAP